MHERKKPRKSRRETQPHLNDHSPSETDDHLTAENLARDDECPRFRKDGEEVRKRK